MEAFFLVQLLLQKHLLDKMYIDNNLPVVILQDWNELNDINLSEKLEVWKEYSCKKNKSG